MSADMNADSKEVHGLYTGFRNPAVIRALVKKITSLAEQLTEPVNIMEVCGGHTHTIMKYGLNQLLPESIEFIHGPGCPVCIMPKERINHGVELAESPEVILVTLGDMIRVPGSRGSLAECRSRGGDVRSVYDPMDALKIARENPDKKVVYFAIGFETTTPMTAVLLELAEQQQVSNLYFHINHVLVPPAVRAVLADGRSRVNALIGPSHVSVVAGAKIYQPLVDEYGVPVVVSGFEPVDVLESILILVRQKVEQKLAGSPALSIQYSRAVTWEGNRSAQDKIAAAFSLRTDFRWRGLGDIPGSALQLKEEFAHRDAELIFSDRLSHKEIPDHKVCICADILRGHAKPNQCRAFGKACNPSRPMGSCMVSSEGACNAYFRYSDMAVQ